jgi:hypothetical protein
LAPTKPTIIAGFSRLNSSATLTSLAKEGVEVWMMSSWCVAAWGSTSCMVSRAGGASMRVESGSSAAGWASQVGNQKLLISRRA